MIKIKSFKVLFESESTSTEESLSIVKEMLKELDFLDFSYNAVIRRGDGSEFIRISIWKPIDQTKFDKRWMKHEDMEKSFVIVDISSVVITIKDYLLGEGWVIDDEKELYNCGIWDGGSFINLRTQYQIRLKK